MNFLNGVMGIANAQRALDYIRIITEFISQPEYKDVIPMFGIINEGESSAEYRSLNNPVFSSSPVDHWARPTDKLVSTLLIALI